MPVITQHNQIKHIEQTEIINKSYLQQHPKQNIKQILI